MVNLETLMGLYIVPRQPLQLPIVINSPIQIPTNIVTQTLQTPIECQQWTLRKWARYKIRMKSASLIPLNRLRSKSRCSHFKQQLKKRSLGIHPNSLTKRWKIWGKKEKAGRMLVMMTPWFIQGTKKVIVIQSGLEAADKSFSAMINIGKIVKKTCLRMWSLWHRTSMKRVSWRILYVDASFCCSVPLAP